MKFIGLTITLALFVLLFFTCSTGHDPGSDEVPAFLLTKNTIMQDTPAADLLDLGWTVCWSSTYSTNGETIESILDVCNAPYLMMACRPVGSANFTLAAWSDLSAVTYDTGGEATPTNTNDSGDVAWYYNENWSWGFAGADDGVDLDKCDTVAVNPEKRLCWHANSGAIDGGYRCGATVNLNTGTTWQRVLLIHN